MRARDGASGRRTEGEQAGQDHPEVRHRQEPREGRRLRGDLRHLAPAREQQRRYLRRQRIGFRGRGGARVRRYENRLSAEGLCAEFSAYRVTSSPPESGGEPEGRGGLKKRQFYGLTSEH